MHVVTVNTPACVRKGKTKLPSYSRGVFFVSSFAESGFHFHGLDMAVPQATKASIYLRKALQNNSAFFINVNSCRGNAITDALLIAGLFFYSPRLIELKTSYFSLNYYF